MRKGRTNVGYHRSLKLRRHLPETYTCLCCGAEYQKGIFNFIIDGYYANRRAGHICLCCLIDEKKRRILENDGYILPVYDDMKKVLKKFKDTETKADFELNRKPQYKKIDYDKED